MAIQNVPLGWVKLMRWQGANLGDIRLGEPGIESS